ncbi:MAG: DUF1592 domain-containing protein [Planctomycetota bacterium]|nr:DUF1592 domain-containing protein [Planctomycetota bacterium]
MRHIPMMMVLPLISISGWVNAQDSSYKMAIQPLLKKYCYECHSSKLAEAELDFEQFPGVDSIRASVKRWVRVDQMLQSKQMPPPDATQLSDDEYTIMKTWVREFLTREAAATAGDPGPVTLRRLSNSEYRYSLQDLTGLSDLDPGAEFPVDGAAGEGFTNTGSALVMSPSLIRKYLEAGKDVAHHAMLTPTGIRWSEHNTRRDWIDSLMDDLRRFYDQHAHQGRTYPEDQRGRLELPRYIKATLEERSNITSGKTTLAEVAKQRRLNIKYLTRLWSVLALGEGTKESFLLQNLHTRWLATEPDTTTAFIADLTASQNLLWKFNTIGHMGKGGGPPSWQEPITPIQSTLEFEIPLTTPAAGSDVIIHFNGGDAGDGTDSDFVLWHNARLESPGQPPIYLKDVQGLAQRLQQIKIGMLSKTTQYLAAANVAAQLAPDKINIPELASRFKIEPAALQTWLGYLVITPPSAVEVSGHFTTKHTNNTYDFVKGWGKPETPIISSNRSDQEVRIPGISRPHSVTLHPSPTLFAAVGWRSPVDATLQLTAEVSDAHPECGNGIEWFLQHRSSTKLGNLASGDFSIGGSATVPPMKITVRKGDLISFIVGPRQGSHACDLTHVNFAINEIGGDNRDWVLGRDTSGRITDSNPLPDRFGHPGTWHFYKGPMTDIQKEAGRFNNIPAASLLADWQIETDSQKRSAIAERVQALVLGEAPADPDSPNGILFEQIHNLLRKVDLPTILASVTPDARFGKHPLGHTTAANDLVVKAPFDLQFRIPGSLTEGRQLVVSGQLEPEHGNAGSVQLHAGLQKADLSAFALSRPIITLENSPGYQRTMKSIAAYRDLFPIALCYTRIVPVDEVVTFILFFREDRYLRELMLNDRQTAELEAMWEEFWFVSQNPLLLVTSIEQISEFATQDRPDLISPFKAAQTEILKQAQAFRERLVRAEAIHIDAVIQFANLAWRHPLSREQEDQIRGLYAELRQNELDHDTSIRLVIARLLASPAFLYKLEEPGPGKQIQPISNTELATRLSYFLWSSVPDKPLRQAAADGTLGDDEVLRQQTQRMLQDPRTRRLAIMFACQWLHIRDFDQNREKNEKLYPGFSEIRHDLYEESVQFFEDMFRNDGSVLDILNADHTFLNESLARHYGIDDITGDQWRKVSGVRIHGRGGVLGLGTVLSVNSGASRTSPILRGNWIYETLLGQQLPRPPANVPQLPDTVPDGLTARELIERHSSDAACSKCHALIDPYGFALEQYDVLGRLRPTPMNTKTRLPTGTELEGIDGLRNYLLTERQDDFLDQFCRKLLGYALGREVQLSDTLLLEHLKAKLKKNDYRFSVAVEAIVHSKQFTSLRGKDIGE